MKKFQIFVWTVILSYFSRFSIIYVLATKFVQYEVLAEYHCCKGHTADSYGALFHFKFTSYFVIFENLSYFKPIYVSKETSQSSVSIHSFNVLIYVQICLTC